MKESRQFGKDWAIVFVASLSGRDGRTPTSQEADQPLWRMRIVAWMLALVVFGYIVAVARTRAAFP